MSLNNCSSVCELADFGCNTDLQLHEVKYFWIINNFDFHEKEGSRLNSPLFSAATSREIKWFLELNPNGDTDAKDTISFYVHLKPDGISDSIHKKVYAKLRATVLNSQQMELCYMGSSDKDKRKISEYSFITSPFHSSMGLKEFLKKDDNFRNNLLPQNKLTIICTIIFSFVRDAFYNTTHCCNADLLYPNLPTCNLVENFEALFENHEFADIVLRVKDKKEYPAHKIILAARSSVFAAMFKHNLKENETNRIDIEDMNEEVVAEMLRYIYTGKCENVGKLADGLLAAADKYHLDRLKMISAEALYKTLSVDNAANILALADLHYVTELKSATIKFVVARFAEVVVSTAWKNMLVSNPELINEVCQAVAGLSSVVATSSTSAVAVLPPPKRKKKARSRTVY